MVAAHTAAAYTRGDTTMEVSFDATKKDMKIINLIVDRAFNEFDNISGDKTDLAMDITATHCNGNKLDLERILTADKFNFAHDVFGIQGNINRRTGKLMRCFLPRFTARPKTGFYSQKAEDERQRLKGKKK